MSRSIIKNSKGFTVLELLVILGIITILIGLVLTGLNAARKHSNDERKVASLKTVVLGLREYFNICRQYPAALTGDETCAALDGQQKKLKDIIPDAVDLNFDGSNSAGIASRYHYTSLVSGGNQDPAECTNFHIWVELDADGDSFSSQKSNKNENDYTALGLGTCIGNTGVPIMQGPRTFDIFK